MDLLYVGIGGFFGAIARYTMTQLIKRTVNAKFPVATMLINLIGAFCLGLMAPVTGPIALLIGTGFLGAFTTFSTFKLESIQMHLNTEWMRFILYVGVTYIGGILLAFLGISITS